MKKRTVIIGIDGVPYGLMDDLSNRGIMPNFRRIKKEGIFTKMRSSIPPLSSISWSSIITGKNPAEHGILGFMELDPKTYTLRFPNFNDLKARSFWHLLKNKKHVIINVPSTYPPKPMNGIHISGFISLDLEKSVYPQKLFSDLKAIDYEVDVDSNLAHKSMSLFLKKLMQSHENRINAFRLLWNKIDWDIFMLVFTGSDRLGHFLWDAYKRKTHEFHNDFINYFKELDKGIGEIVVKMKNNDTLLVLSDHGMGKMKINVNINAILEKKGFLVKDKQYKSFNQINQKTTAFALEPGRIYIHTKAKYPRGIVKTKDKKDIVKKLTQIFTNARYKNKKIIKNIYTKDEIYTGKYLRQAPDLILLPNKGFRLRAQINSDIIYTKDIFSGDHTLEDAFFFIKSKQDITIPDNMTVEDFVPILLNLMV